MAARHVKAIGLPKPSATPAGKRSTDSGANSDHGLGLFLLSGKARWVKSGHFLRYRGARRMRIFQKLATSFRVRPHGVIHLRCMDRLLANHKSIRPVTRPTAS